MKPTHYFILCYSIWGLFKWRPDQFNIGWKIRFLFLVKTLRHVNSHLGNFAKNGFVYRVPHWIAMTLLLVFLNVIHWKLFASTIITFFDIPYRLCGVSWIADARSAVQISRHKWWILLLRNYADHPLCCVGNKQGCA